MRDGEVKGKGEKDTWRERMGGDHYRDGGIPE